jgi:predicted phage terminase large subunit-like protein
MSLSSGRSDRDLLDAALRTDFSTFVEAAFNLLNPGTEYAPNWHIEAIAHHLELVRLGKIRRLIITMPPRSLKSLSASIAFPAFIHGHDPTRSVIGVTYSQDLSNKLSREYRSLISSAFYQRLFPHTRIDARKDSESEVALTAKGGRLSTSVGGTLTGRGAHFIILDDPLKAQDAFSTTKRDALNTWFGSTLVSRLNDKETGAIIIVTQRLHSDDLIGYILAQSENWTVLDLPAIANESFKVALGEGRHYLVRKDELLHPCRESRTTLEDLRRELGSEAFAAQYLQQPIPPGGAMFQRAWIQRYSQAPSFSFGDEIVQSWDTATKTSPDNDWSVCTTWLRRAGNHYLLHVFRERLNYPGLRAKAVELARRFDPRMVLVEDTGVGMGLVPELREAGVNVWPVKAIDSKEVRASLQTATFEGGRVYLPKQAPWLDAFEAELFSFPGGRHDDQVDSAVQALAYQHIGTVTRTIAIPM